MKKFFLMAFLLAGSVAAQTLPEYMAFTRKWEGTRHFVYKDFRGNKTIGVGHKLSKDENLLIITTAKVNQLFVSDMVDAYVGARQSVKNFDTLPPDVKLIVADMVFNLGTNGFSKFKKAIAACESNDWQKMALELRASLWYKQTGNRAKHHVKILEQK